MGEVGRRRNNKEQKANSNEPAGFAALGLMQRQYYLSRSLEGEKELHLSVTTLQVVTGLWRNMDPFGIFGPVKGQNRYMNLSTKACRVTAHTFPEKVVMVEHFGDVWSLKTLAAM